MKTDPRGRVQVNEHYQTNLPHIYAARRRDRLSQLGFFFDGTRARCRMHAFGVRSAPAAPYSLWDLYRARDFHGRAEERETDFIQQEVPYEIGIARYREIAGVKSTGDKVGMLKLLFHQDSRQILGVHAIGQGVTELIHIGQTAMAFNGTIDYFIENTLTIPLSPVLPSSWPERL